MKIFHIDAFTSKPFAGNPAAVCLDDGSAQDDWMQQVAMEMNLSETAFVRAQDDGFLLRWFTPEAEVPLCGHATLASAHALWESGTVTDDTIRFHSLSGVLHARRRDGRIEIELPAAPLEEHRLPQSSRKALGIDPLWCGRTSPRGLGDRDVLVELGSEAEVRAAQPDFRELRREPKAGIIITARSDTAEQDFVSRYFAPWWGINEDPVTGAAHCALVPFWARKLDKSTLIGYQASRRGGRVHGRLEGDRVLLSGEAVTVLEGNLTLSGKGS